MEKIAVIGPSGAGKSTLAKKLRRKLHIRVYHLDRLFWRSDWKRKDQETRIDILQYLVWERYWIIDGSYLNSSDLHLYEANIIIFLDIPSIMCCYRIIKRHFEPQERPRRDIPVGSSDRITLLGILQLLFFPLGARRKLEDKLRKLASKKKVIRLQSPEEVEAFLAQFDPRTDEKI